MIYHDQSDPYFVRLLAFAFHSLRRTGAASTWLRNGEFIIPQILCFTPRDVAQLHLLEENKQAQTTTTPDTN